ncbi:hypothetical protein [Desulfocastanea catecholica]
MSEAQKYSDRNLYDYGQASVTPRQLDLFNQTNLATVMRDVKTSMNQCIKDSGKSREQVLDMMNALAARYGQRMSGRGGLSKDTFEKWLNCEEDSHMPTVFGLNIFCAALQTLEPMAAMVRLQGGAVIEGQDIILLKLAKKEQQINDLRKQMKQLKDKL